MVGGFLLGGLLGSLLFGGLGGISGGIGFMDLLVMAGLAALVISFLRELRRNGLPRRPSPPRLPRPPEPSRKVVPPRWTRISRAAWTTSA